MEDKEKVNLDRSLRNLLMDGIASQIMFSLITVPIISSYLASINADSFTIGLVAAIPFLSQLIQIPSVVFAEKYSRKKNTLLTNFISRFSLLLIGVALLINGYPDISLFIILFAIYNLFKEASTVSWSSWMRDLIPAHIRGEFYSKRIAYGKFVALFIVLTFTFIFNFLGRLAFSLVFITAFAAGIVSLHFIRGVDDVEIEWKPQGTAQRFKLFKTYFSTLHLEICFRNGFAFLFSLHHHYFKVSNMGRHSLNIC
jgi:hypothetical protein